MLCHVTRYVYNLNLLNPARVRQATRGHSGLAVDDAATDHKVGVSPTEQPPARLLSR
jgi:hypothetical protein